MLMTLPIVWDILWFFLITCEMDTLISSSRILPDLLSGHQVVVRVIDLLQPPATCITVAHQRTQDIDLYAFQKDICCVFYKESVDDLDDMITTYDNTLHLNVLYSTPSVSLLMSLLMVLRLSFSHQKVKVVPSIHYLLGC